MTRQVRNSNVQHSPRLLIGIVVAWIVAMVVPANAQQLVEAMPQLSTVRQLDFQKPLGTSGVGFARFSQELSVEDPLSEFFEYLLDPINWDPTEMIYPRMNMLSNVGIANSWGFLNGRSAVRLGLRSRMDQARVWTLPFQGATALEVGRNQNLIDIMYTPYLGVETSPASWLTLTGLVQIDTLQRDLQGVCRTSCSVDPGAIQQIVVPGFKTRLAMRPMDTVLVFAGVGRGFFRFDDREPAGSVAEQQLNRASFAEAGFSVKPTDRVEWGGTFWTVRAPQDVTYVPEDEDFAVLGPTKRYGLSLTTHVQPFDGFTFSGTFAHQDGAARVSGESINLPATWQAQTSVQYQWNTDWTTTVQWQYVQENPVLPGTISGQDASLNRIDFLARYEASRSWGTVSGVLGILNICDSGGSGTRFAFDSGLGNDPVQAIDRTYFSRQPRMVVGGFSVNF